ncbi:MAG: diacylglycerol kinase family protein [Myxococcota bacterium]
MTALVHWLSARRRSFGFAFSGVGRLLSEANFRVHLAALACVLVLGSWLDLGGTEWACTLLAAALVLVAEGFNTALELLADAVAPNRHPLVGLAKDVAAGAVLLSAAAAIVIAAFIMGPKLLLRFGA